MVRSPHTVDPLSAPARLLDGNAWKWTTGLATRPKFIHPRCPAVSDQVPKHRVAYQDVKKWNELTTSARSTHQVLYVAEAGAADTMGAKEYFSRHKRSGHRGGQDSRAKFLFDYISQIEVLVINIQRKIGQLRQAEFPVV